MGKKGGGSKHNVKNAVTKAKKSGQFKSLTKHETRQVVVQTERKGGAVQQRVVAKPKKHVPRVPDEFRNFDERMAATRLKKQAARTAPAPANAIVAAPSFVMPVATFQFNTAAPAQEAPREVEGFHGFLAAMQAPATAPQPSAPRETRKQKPVAPRNVFVVLDDEPDPVAPTLAQPIAAPSFLQPATFTFQTHASRAPTGPSTAGMTSLQRSLLGPAAPSPFTHAAMDPDL